MNTNESAAPVQEKFFTTGVIVMLTLIFIGLVFGAARFILGIGAVTNLNNQFPWGIWIGIDVASGVALAAGGFTTGFIAYVLNRNQYHAVIRPALLTAMLGYTFVVIGLLFDIGRYWNITSPLFNHNGNSVLFEVAVCVMIYLNVLYIEFIPIVVERFKNKVNLPGPMGGMNNIIESILGLAGKYLSKVMWAFIILGIVLSCLHQSSLGTLMLIAPSKVHPLWYTPILPLLFLFSAFATGYPMVVVESILVSKSFGRKPEMEVLTPLAKTMPIMIGLYAAVKLGDMLVRGTYIYLLDGTYQTNAFLAEIILGVMLPLIMLLSRRVRNSPRWLFFASIAFVLGVVLNRINVFTVSYRPPYIIDFYFPAVGEIFITIGLVSTLMLSYRVLVHIFPILSEHPQKILKTALVVFLVMGTWSVNNCKAEENGILKSTMSNLAAMESPLHQIPKLLILNDSTINKYSDIYEPVRFMHGKHANVLKDCTICHHRMPENDGDRHGKKITMSALRKQDKTPASCTTCHQKPFEADRLEISGLKGALHQRCINCHNESSQVPYIRGELSYSSMAKGSITRSLDNRAPTNCISCHPKKVPDHNQLVKLKDNPGALAVTQNCLSCHQKEGDEIIKTAHWKWQGSSPYTVGHEGRIDLGKSYHSVNNFCLNINGNWKDCTGCHIGYGWTDQNFDFNDTSKIDCVVCHDNTDWNEYVKTDGGWPVEDVDLKLVAENVGRPNRGKCGTCHFYGGHGDATKHGALSSALDELEDPTRDLDVHMGGKNNFKCQYCHKTKKHMISGRTVSSSVSEGDVSCEYCHTDKPHFDTTITSHHLNKHSEHIACQTCHIPVFSKAKPTEIYWDWSTAGEHSEHHHGTKIKKQAGKPSYLWYNGTAGRYILGDQIDENSVTQLTTPMGEKDDSSSRIYPFKAHGGKQISDKNNNFLLPAQLWSGYTVHWDWDKAIKEAIKTTDLKYSGEYEFVETIMYFPLTHEVLPKEKALSCVNCHSTFQKNDCSLCHQKNPSVDYKAMVKKGIDFEKLAKGGLPVEELIGTTDYIDFKALGYPGDPIKTGLGRFTKLPIKFENK